VKLIGINGFKRSGKGETGNAIYDVFLDHNAGAVQLLGFADKLKILGAKTLGFVDRSDEECIALMDECKEEWIFSILKRFDDQPEDMRLRFPAIVESEFHRLSGREYLQHMGTQARKVFGADFWVDQVLPPPSTVRDVGNLAFGNPYEPHLVARNMRILSERYPDVSAVAFTDLRFENEAQRILDLGGEVWEVLRPGTASDGHASEQVLPRALVTRQIHNTGDLANLRYEVEKALGV
jgi:hypothetical protein